MELTCAFQIIICPRPSIKKSDSLFIAPMEGSRTREHESSLALTLRNIFIYWFIIEDNVRTSEITLQTALG